MYLLKTRNYVLLTLKPSERLQITEAERGLRATLSNLISSVMKPNCDLKFIYLLLFLVLVYTKCMCTGKCWFNMYMSKQLCVYGMSFCLTTYMKTSMLFSPCCVYFYQNQIVTYPTLLLRCFRAII